MLTIYHNPRCSKSRKTLALLDERDVAYNVIEYLKTPPTTQEIKAILVMLGMDARSLLRKKESLYKTKGLDNSSLSEGALISAIAADPILMERPIVLSKDKAIIGRPPENVLSLI